MPQTLKKDRTDCLGLHVYFLFVKLRNVCRLVLSAANTLAPDGAQGYKNMSWSTGSAISK